MSNRSVSEKSALRGVFGVFPLDHEGTVGDLFGMWHHTLGEAEQHLSRITEHLGKNYTVMSKTEHEKRISEQQEAGLAFKTGHDRLMDEFDQWLKQNHLVRGAVAAVMMGLPDKEFKSGIKRGFIKRQSMPNHDNLVGYPADLVLSKEQHEQLMNERTFNARQVAEELGVTQKEYVEIKRQSDIANSDALLGRTVPNESGSAYLYSRADIQKLLPVAHEVKSNRPKPARSNKD